MKTSVYKELSESMFDNGAQVLLELGYSAEQLIARLKEIKPRTPEQIADDRARFADTHMFQA